MNRTGEERRSLYATLGQPITAIGEPKPPPDTIYTATIETVDNDHATAHAASLRLGGPGTRHTLTFETIDDDSAAASARLLLSERSIDEPGTRLTEAVETVDEDGTTAFGLL